MDQNYGRLILLQQGGPEREFGLSKASISLGRGLANDIVLADLHVSREHARIDCGPLGCTVIDLGSANSTQLNGQQVRRASLKPGDIIGLGDCRLRYQASSLVEDMELTRLDSEADLELSLEHEILPTAINETGMPRLVVFTEEETWEVPLDDSEAITIGRADDSDLVLERDLVSRRHAELARRGKAWRLRDLGSTNGTWYRGKRIEEVLLNDGDTFRIGRVQVMLKGGLDPEAMTMLEESFARLPSRRPVVFVPGLMGSQLWLGSERVWPSVRGFLAKPDMFKYPSELPLEARGIVDEVVIVPNLIKQDQYNRLGDYLVEELGYRRGVDLFEFAYDWRQDVRLSARELGALVDRLPVATPVTIMAHSLGTLVSRYYIERLGGHKRVERAMLMGGPHHGTVKGMASLLVAPQMLPFGLMGERFRRVLATFPSCYQILPTYPSGIDQDGNKLDFVQDESWLAEEQLPLMRAGREFRQELGLSSSVPTISIFGYGIKTMTHIRVHRTPSGAFERFEYETEPRGDSGILETSAVLPGTEIHPVQQYHGSLFVDNDVRMRLKLELARQHQFSL
jgi:pSer/pThr/pTyr-binding forkhead associated (FHA) protein